MAPRTPSRPTINQSRSVLRGSQIASQPVDSGAAATDRAEVGSPEHKTTISELAGDAAKASRSLSALHRELLAALLRFTRRVSTDPRAAALVRDRGLDNRRDTDASSMRRLIEVSVCRREPPDCISFLESGIRSSVTDMR
jgi:hypothetical protein